MRGTYLVLRGDASKALADAGERADPLGRVPSTRLLVATNLADTHRNGTEARALGGTPEELLRDPLALAVAHAVRDARLDIERLRRGGRVCVVCRQVLV